jgi:hypothetical protein
MARDQLLTLGVRTRRQRTAEWIVGSRRVITIAIVVGVWWVLIAGSTALTLPVPAASTPTYAFTVAPDQRAHIHQPGIPHWPIPVDRIAYDEYYRGVRESDEGAIEYAFEVSEWIEAKHGQAVLIAVVDGEAVHIELLEGAYAGRRGWVQTRHLAP